MKPFQLTSYNILKVNRFFFYLYLINVIIKSRVKQEFQSRLAIQIYSNLYFVRWLYNTHALSHFLRECSLLHLVEKQK